MENFTALLGIISLFVVGVYCGVVSESTVTITTPDLQLMPGDTAELSCMGGSKAMEYYISNRVIWNFKNKDGQEFPIVEGFYKTTKEGPLGEYARKNFESGHFKNSYNTKAEYYSFVLKINGVNDGDDGQYICSLIDAGDAVLDTKTLSLTVLHAVEKVTLEVHDPQTHQVLIKKTTPVAENDVAISLKPGPYMVKCTATGSNPGPRMKFMYNEDEPYINAKIVKDTSGSRVQYSGSFSFSEFDLMPMGMKDQFLTCSAEIQGTSPMVAAVKMHVKVDIPNVECENVSSILGDHYATVNCNVTAPGGGVQCDNIKWIVGNTNEILQSVGKFGAENGNYDIMETDCESMDEGVMASLQFYKVMQTHFDTIFYISYGAGDDAYRVPIQLQQKPGSASFITPVSLLVYLLITFIARQAGQRF